MNVERQYGTYITNAGTARITDAALSGEKVRITEIAAGDGDGSYYVPSPEMKSLKNETWRDEIAKRGSTEIDKTSPNIITVKAIIPAEIGTFTIREIGLFDDQGTMLAICNTPDMEKSIIEAGALGEIALEIKIAVSNTDVFEIVVDPHTAIATKQDVEDARAESAEQFADLNTLSQGFGRVYFKRRADAWTGDVHAYFWSSVILNPAWDWYKSPNMKQDNDGLYYIERPGDYEQLIFMSGFEMGQPKTNDLVVPPEELCRVPLFIQHPYGQDGHWVDKSSMTQRLLIKGPQVEADFSEQNLTIHYRKWSDHERTSIPAMPLGVAGYYYADVPVGTDDFYLSLSNDGEMVVSQTVVCSSNSYSFPLYNASWIDKRNITDEEQYFTNYDGSLNFQLPENWQYADVIFADGRTVIADCIDHYNRIYRVPANRYDENTYETVYDDFKVRYQDKETSMTQQLHPNPGRKIYNVQTGAWIDYPTVSCSKYFTITTENLYDRKNSEYLAAWDTAEHKRLLNAIAQAVSASYAAGQVRVDLLAQIGTLANLTTISKNNLVNAINSLAARTAWIIDTVSEQLSSWKLYPNRLYVWRTPRSSIQITELLTNAGDTATTLNEYRIQFTAGSDFSFAFPSAVRWQGGVTPTFTSGATYQISILNNIARVM